MGRSLERMGESLSPQAVEGETEGEVVVGVCVWLGGGDDNGGCCVTDSCGGLFMMSGWLALIRYWQV